MLNVILYALLAWFLYNLVFRFIIPVYKTARQMKQKFREMQDRMQSPASEKNDFRGTQNPGSKTTSKTPREDYIDFEEVK